MREDRRKRRWLRRNLLPLIPVLGATFWFASPSVAYLANLRLYSIPSGSMAPALLPGDRVAVDRTAGTPARGEIWLFTMPNGNVVVKRVIGLPGEEVRISGGHVLIDGQPRNEPYLALPMTYEMPATQLGSDKYFVLGDDRDNSHDSHVFGPIAKGQLLGRAVQRYRPGVGIGRLR